MIYDKAELDEVEIVLKPARKCDVCSSLGVKLCALCKKTHILLLKQRGRTELARGHRV